MQIFVNGLGSIFAADAAAFVAPEGGHVADGAVGVHPNRAGFQTFAHRKSAANALGPHARGQAKHRRVGNAEGVFFVIKRNDGEHRAKHFFVGDAHVLIYARKNRRFDEPAIAAFGARGRGTSQAANGSFVFGDADVVENFLVLGPRGDGAHLGCGFEGIAHLRGLRQREQLIDKLIVHRAMNQRARAGDAGLPGRREDAGDHTFDGFVEISVIENNVGGLAAQFQRDVLDPARGGLIDVFAGFVAAGESDFVDAGMRQQWFAHFVAEACDDVDDAGREAGFFEELPKRERRYGRIFRRFPHHRATGGQRGRKFPRGQHQG